MYYLNSPKRAFYRKDYRYNNVAKIHFFFEKCLFVMKIIIKYLK